MNILYKILFTPIIIISYLALSIVAGVVIILFSPIAGILECINMWEEDNEDNIEPPEDIKMEPNDVIL